MTQTLGIKDCKYYIFQKLWTILKQCARMFWKLGKWKVGKIYLIFYTPNANICYISTIMYYSILVFTILITADNQGQS